MNLAQRILGRSNPTSNLDDLVASLNRSLSAAATKAGKRAPKAIAIEHTSDKTGKKYIELTWGSETLDTIKRTTPYVLAWLKKHHPEISPRKMFVRYRQGGKIIKYAIWNTYFMGFDYQQGPWKEYRSGVTWLLSPQ